MRKILLTCVMSSVALAGCSGDKSAKDNSFQPNSQIQVVPAAQIANVQQAEEFPHVVNTPASQQYAAANQTNAMPQTTMSDVDGGSGTTLSAMTDQTVNAYNANNTQPAANNPSNMAIPSVNNPALPTPTANPTTTTVAQPSPAVVTTSIQTPVQSTPTTAPATNPMTTSTPAMTTAPATNPMQPAAQQPQTMPATTTTPVTTQTTSQTTINTTPVSEQYQALDAEKPTQSQTTVKSSNPYSNFENVAIPVTFSNSPYNQALKEFSGTSEKTTSTTAQPASTKQQQSGGGAVLANQPAPTNNGGSAPANSGSNNNTTGTMGGGSQ